MEQKKILNRTHLVYVALVQLILIDLVLVGFFILQIQIRNNPVAADRGNKYQVNRQTISMTVHRLAFKNPSTPLHNEFLNGLIQRVHQNEIQYKKDISLKYVQMRLQKNEKDSFHFNNDVLGIIPSELPWSPWNKRVVQSKFPSEEAFIATTYDLSYASCGKYPSNPAYGITFSGKRAVKGRTVAVDPDVIPLGSGLYIEFPDPYTHFNGWYVAEDTGSKVKGNIIDVFLGQSAFFEMEKFGSRIVKVRIYPPGTTSLNGEIIGKR